MFDEVFDTMIAKYVAHDTCVWYMDNFWLIEVYGGGPRQWLSDDFYGLKVVGMFGWMIRRIKERGFWYVVNFGCFRWKKKFLERQRERMLAYG